MTTVTSHRAAAPSRPASANPLAPAYGTSPNKDLAAIGSFLEKHWNVGVGKDDAKALAAARTAVEGLVKKNGLDVGRFKELAARRPGDSPAEQLTRTVFAYGVLAGERYELSQAKSQIDLINRLREIRSKPSRGDLPMVDALPFGDVVEALTRTLAKTAALKAEPKGWAAYKKTAGEYDPPGPEADDFKGKKLHPSLGASIGDFGDSASRASVFYNQVRDRSPLNTLVGAVFRQGMNLGVLTLEKPLKVALDRALVDAGMPGVIGGRTRRPDGFDR